MEDSRVRVLLVPFPITPLVAFGYFIYRYFGLLASDVKIRYLATSTEKASYYFARGTVLRFGFYGLYEELGALIQNHSGEQRYLLRRILDYCRSSSEHGFAERLLECSYSVFDPRPVLESAFLFFEKCLLRKRDLWKEEWDRDEEKDGTFFLRPFVVEPEIPNGFRFGTFPVLKNNDPKEKEVVKTASYKLVEGMARLLEEESLGLAVIGPPSSGKSTLAFSLAVRMNHLLDSLKSRGGVWGKFPFKVELVNLDLATPTDEGAIGLGLAKDREMMRELKCPWTMELALEAMEKFSRVKVKPNLIIADLPGKADAYTEVAASLADVAIIITNKWRGEMPVWTELSNRLGLTLVAQVRSRLPEEGFSSLITRYNPGGFVTGRIEGLDRVDSSCDPCVSLIAEFLLFDILPAIVRRRRKKIRSLLRVEAQ